MTRALTIPIACAALALAAGCGSSGSSGTTETTGGGAAAATSSSSPTATSPSSPPKGGASKGGAKSGSSGGLQYNTTPKYAAPSPSAPVQGGVVQIAYRNIAIDPDTARVKVGSTVRWTNYDPVEHNVTSKSGPTSFASRTFPEGRSFEVKLNKPGVIHYLCTIHPTTMNGTIEVVK